MHLLNTKNKYWSEENLTVPDLKDIDTIAIDTEETDLGLQAGLGSGWYNKNGEVLGLSLSFVNDEKFHRSYFPFHHPGYNIPQSMFEELKECLAKFTGTIVFHNAVFDIGWLETIGITFNKDARIVDTGYAAALLDENRFSYRLDDLAKEELGIGKDYTILEEYMREHKIRSMDEMMKRLGELPASHVGPYAEQDAEVTLRLWQIYEKQLSKNKLNKVFNLECRGIPLLIAMRKQGVPIDIERVKYLIEDFKEREIAIQEELDAMAGEPFPKTRTAKQVEIIVRVVGKENFSKSAAGNYLTGKKHVGRLKHPFLEKIKQLNSIRKLRKDFLENFLKFEVNGRIHAEFHPLKTSRDSVLMSTKTGRYSSTCIAEGELVAAFGADIPIENIRTGELVYCFDNNNNLAVRKVIARKRMGAKPCVRVRLFNYYTKEKHTLICTPDHLIRTAIDTWVEAGALRPGSQVRSFPTLTRDDVFLTVVEVVPDMVREVYDLEIEEYHNFIVSEVCVHNCPNLTNIPADGELGKLIRSCFIPDEGCDWFCADYSQQEYRWAAHFAIAGHATGWETVRDMYAKDPHLDFHNMGSQLLFGNVDPHNRKKVKTLGFGILYGQGLDGFAQGLGCSREEAATLLEHYKEKVPFVTSIMQKAKAFVESHGYIRTKLGRIRHYDFFEVNSTNRELVKELGVVKGHANAIAKTMNKEDPWFNQTVKRYKTYSAINSVCQGSSADQTKAVAVALFERYGIVPYTIVHDEFNIPIPKGDTVTAQRVIDTMENIFKLEVPVKAEGGLGKNWAEAKH